MNTSSFSQSLEQYKQAIIDQVKAQIDLAQEVENQFGDYSEKIDKSLQKIINSLNSERIETLFNERFERFEQNLQEISRKLDGSIVSKRGIDYTRLKNYLVNADWEKAKQESLSIIRSMVVENTENLIKGLQQQTSSTVSFNEIEYNKDGEEEKIPKECSFEEHSLSKITSYFLSKVWSWSWSYSSLKLYGSLYDLYLYQLYSYIGEKSKHKHDALLSEEKLDEMGLLRFFNDTSETNIRFSELESLFENLKSSFRDYVLQVVDHQFIQEIIIINKLWETLSHQTLGLSSERKRLKMLELVQNCVSKGSVPTPDITNLWDFENDIFLNFFPDFSKYYVHEIEKDSYENEEENTFDKERNRITEKYFQKSSCKFSCIDILEALKYDQFFEIIKGSSALAIHYKEQDIGTNEAYRMREDYENTFELLTMNFQWELFNTLHSLIEEVESAGNSNTDRSSS